MTTERNRKKKFSDIDHANWVTRYAKGESTVTIAKDYGTTAPVVGWLLKARGVRMRSQSESRKLSEEQVEEIYRLRAAGYMKKEIADEVGCSYSTVTNYLREAGLVEPDMKSLARRKANFLAKAKEVHGDKYDYSKVDYQYAESKVEIVCPEHGSFEQTPNNHLLGRGCPACAAEKQAERKTTHGMRSHTLYTIWVNMNARCHDKSNKGYKDYGGRGIKVYQPWRAAWAGGPEDGSGVQNFIEYMESTLGPKPTPEHSIDRVDNDEGYVPGNLRWADKAEQVANRRPPSEWKPVECCI